MGGGKSRSFKKNFNQIQAGVADLITTGEKSEILHRVKEYLESRNYTISSSDETRPWGGFFVIDEQDSERFIRDFFPHLQPEDFKGFAKLSPKFLVVAPGKRLSWQYHHRRSEVWRVVKGTAGVIVSATDEQTPVKTLTEGDHISLKKGERHRLTGLDEWAILAEIWQHTDPDHLSDEEDIVRIEDDFGR